MNRRSPNSAAVPTLLAAALLLPLAGCARKKPTPPPAQPAAVTQEVAAPAPAAAPRPADPVPSPLDGELIAAQEHAYRTGLLGDVYFAFDLATLDEAARERLAKNADFLRQRPEFVVTLEGHCDERGTNEYNLALGERRAQSAREYLVSLGIEPARLLSLSYGEERPACSESEEGCWQRNRRVHFLLSGRR
jgi:peptidoglycan-associated lipoprotein